MIVFDWFKMRTRSLRRCLRTKYQDFLKIYAPKRYADILYKKQFGYNIDWRNPRDINEKIQWLMFYTDISEWVRLADKYRVREFVKERGCEEILIPLYGKWDRAEDIDWNALPNRFVIKANHGSGDARIVMNKSTEDLLSIQLYMQDVLSKPFGIDSAEIHYRKIKPCVIAEELLLPDKAKELADINPDFASVTDYKIWCFGGKPYYIFTGSNRNLVSHTVDFNIFDLEWNRHNEWMSDAFRNNALVPKPKHLDEMYEYAKKLSAGFPQVRVDLYECNDKVYFGEMTFTSQFGRMDYFTPYFLKIMGDMCKI